MSLQDIYTEIMSEARRWEESGNEYEDTRELGVSEGLLLASEIVKKYMSTSACDECKNNGTDCLHCMRAYSDCYEN